MKLYKEKGVNPLGGCLPMMLQMPLLFALFQVFRTTIELRAEPFVWWIKDLSAPDAFFNSHLRIPCGNFTNSDGCVYVYPAAHDERWGRPTTPAKNHAIFYDWFFLSHV